MLAHPIFEELLGVPNILLPGFLASHFVDYNWVSADPIVLAFLADFEADCHTVAIFLDELERLI